MRVSRVKGRARGERLWHASLNLPMYACIRLRPYTGVHDLPQIESETSEVMCTSEASHVSN